MTALPTLDRAFSDEETAALLESYQLPSSDELLNHAAASKLSEILVARNGDCWAAVVDEKVKFNAYDESRSIYEILQQYTLRIHFLGRNGVVWRAPSNGSSKCEIYMHGEVEKAWKAVLELVDRSDPHNPKWKVKFFGNYPL